MRTLADMAAQPQAWVPAGTRVYAIGDSHGCLDLLKNLQEQILGDSGTGDTSPERRVVVYLGDYIDRGPDSRGLIDRLIDEPLPGFESVLLKGNHDEMLLRLIDEGAAPPNWALHGIFETLDSYGIDPSVWHHGAAAVRAAVIENLPAHHLAFLRSLRYSHVEGDYFFAHAGVRPGVPLEAQSPRDLMWIRDDFLDSDMDHGKIVVHGHTPVELPDTCTNRIGIDTGAVYGGALTALVLEGTERRFLQAR
jgi:serine/threonine protein phosphatase 1